MYFLLKINHFFSGLKKKVQIYPADTPVKSRIYFLDGLRGWGAVGVVLYHFWVAGFPKSQEIATFLQKIFIFNGGLAVYIFFMVSGFSLTVAYFTNNNYLILKKILIGRYFRLILPIGIASLICFICMKTKIIPPVELRTGNWKNFLVTTPSIIEFVRFHFFDVFYNFSHARSLIPPLWTMEIEFIGSIILLSSLLFVNELKSKFFFFILCCVSFWFNYLYSLFFIGAALAWFYSQFTPKNTVLIGYLASIVALISSWFFKYFDTSGTFSILFQTGCCLSFFISAMYCKPVQDFLSSPISLYLGKISFSLYLIHSVVMWTVGLRIMDSVSNWLLNGICIVVSLILAHFLSYFDRIAIKLSRKVGNSFFSANTVKERCALSAEA